MVVAQDLETKISQLGALMEKLASEIKEARSLAPSMQPPIILRPGVATRHQVWPVRGLLGFHTHPISFQFIAPHLTLPRLIFQISYLISTDMSWPDLI